MKNLKLMIVSNLSSADLELIGFLAQQSGLEVITVTPNNLSSIRSTRSPEAKLKAFQSLLDGKPLTDTEPDDANWKAIDNLAHNKELDERESTDPDSNTPKWHVINLLEHNNECDENM